MSLKRIRDEGGHVTGYVGVAEDMTERRQAEGALVEALDRERQAVEQLRELDRIKEDFVSRVSHELRTPITSVLGYTEMLEDGALRRARRAPARRRTRVGRNSRGCSR